MFQRFSKNKVRFNIKSSEEGRFHLNQKINFLEPSVPQNEILGVNVVLSYKKRKIQKQAFQGGIAKW